MKILNLIICCTITISSYAQEKELEHFRKELTTFINYDNEKTGSLAKSETNTITLQKNMNNAFLAFVNHKDSKDLESMKKNGKTDGKRTYWFNNNTYSFGELRRDVMSKSTENNLNYHIGFKGLYDYKLPNFVSIYIQPFTVGRDDYVIYYYKLNGAGKYYIKNIRNNQVIYAGEALTSNAPVRIFKNINENYFLLLEDMGDDGQRALVLRRTKTALESIEAFKGKSFLPYSKDYTKKTFTEKRKYLRLASTRTIYTHLGFFESVQNLLTFNEASKTISYSVTRDNSKAIASKWENAMFIVDDYYLGEHFEDEPLPFPRP